MVVGVSRIIQLCSCACLVMAVPVPFDIPQKLFHLQILDKCQEYGEAIALRDTYTDRELSFLQVKEYSYRLAAALRDLGVKKDDRLLVLLPNTIEYPLIFLASALLGAAISGVSPQLARDEILQLAERCETQFIVTDDDGAQKMKDPTDYQVLLLDLLSPSFSHQGRSLHSLLPRRHEDLFFDCLSFSVHDVLIAPFSSGTTGIPKCVLLTHDNFNTETAILKNTVFDRLEERRRSTLALLPFHHGSGFWALVYCLLQGHHSVVMRHFSLALKAANIDKYQIDTINVVPSLVAALSRAPPEFQLDSVRTVLCGSAPLGKELAKAFLDRFTGVTNLIQGYGMTEVVVLSHVTPVGELLPEDKLGTCGKLLPGFEAKILDERGLPVEEGECGELYLRGRSVMKGYLNVDEDEDPVDEDGWLRTGDVAVMDENGFYFIVDRVKDVFKVHGRQVSPVEIESVLLSHPLVHEAAVVGVPSEHSGHAPKAFLVLEQGAGHEDIPAIERHVRERLAPYKHLTGGIALLDSIPRSSSGKVLRRMLLTTMPN